ncbi:MAG: cation:proton antiporter [Chloroflexi bacterium]|nr:cation:proton antiporter [Chloroflexota bacterium]
MENLSTLLLYLASFVIITLASKQIGQYFNRVKLPLISGFLFTGVIAGPYVLGLIPANSLENLRFIDEIALAVIAFAAGNELYIKELRDRLKSITWITTGLVISTFTLGTLTIILFGNAIPFMQNMSIPARVAVAILGGAILVARSPSSAIAIVNELRAKGPFTRTALGVTVIMDVVVIVLFGVNSSIADALLTNLPFNLVFVGLLIFELAASFGIGYLLYRILQFILSTTIHQYLKTALVLVLGYSVFIFSGLIRETAYQKLPFEILVEPLLICMFGGFLVSSFSNYRNDFSRILQQVGLAIYVLFFTLTGASLALDPAKNLANCPGAFCCPIDGYFHRIVWRRCDCQRSNAVQPAGMDGLCDSSWGWPGVSQRSSRRISDLGGCFCDGAHLSYCSQSDCRASFIQVGHKTSGGIPHPRRDI